MTSTYILDFNSLKNNYKEPNIVKAQFIFSPNRIYTLEFDQNITMHELKIMIQKAAHLSSKNFRLFSDGEEYSYYEQETFESLFRGQKIVIFSLEAKLNELSDETELLLQMDYQCEVHIDKFLLYYCFTCGESVCCDCFTKGIHRGHQIQEKFFYLLPSKILVDKLFENCSKNPYEEYKNMEDPTLEELRVNLNEMLFDNIIEMLDYVQNRVVNLLEKYHYVNNQIFDSVRNSIRDTKAISIKILDELKEKMNVKNIINNEQIFLDFDTAYKKLGCLQKNKLKTNYTLYQELNKQIPGLIKNLITDINDKISFTLNQLYNDQRFDNILNEIEMKSKSIKSFNQEDIKNELNIHLRKNYDESLKKNLNINYIYNNYFDKNKEELEVIFNEEKLEKRTIGQNEVNSKHADNIHQNYQNNNLFSFGYSNNINNVTNYFFLGK